MRFAPLLFTMSLFALGGCTTLQDLKSDVSEGLASLGRQAIPEPTDPAKEAKKQLPVYDGSCPPVSIRPDLKTLTEFYNPDAPSEDSKISDVAMTDVKGICRVENNSLVLQIDFTFEGKTGPKARIQPSDKPSFAYPYFVAVTDANGTVVSKEMFAATVAYGADDNEITQTETIFQNMPFPDASIGQVFNVVVGFQLSPEQLTYNQAHATAASF